MGPADALRRGGVREAGVVVGEVAGVVVVDSDGELGDTGEVVEGDKKVR
jgi:hypothetical protein